MRLSLLGRVLHSMKSLAGNSSPSSVTTVLTTWSCGYCAEGNRRRCFPKILLVNQDRKEVMPLLPLSDLFFSKWLSPVQPQTPIFIISGLLRWSPHAESMLASFSLLQQADVRPQVTSHPARDNGCLDKSADAYAWHLFSNRYRNRICVGPLWRSCYQPSIWGNSSGAPFMCNIWYRTMPFLKKKALNLVSNIHSLLQICNSLETSLRSSWELTSLLREKKKQAYNHGTLIS